MQADGTWWPFGDRGNEFKAYIEEREGSLAETAIEAVAEQLPELVGPDPQLKELLFEAITSNLDNFAAAIAYHVPSEAQFEPPAAVEHARLLAQRGVTANSILLGYQIVQRVLAVPVIEAVQTFVEDRDELVRTLEAVMVHHFAQGDASLRAALRTHATARDAWLRGRGAGLSKRLDAVLDRVVTDVQMAERTLDYTVSGSHVAFIAWIDDPERPLDMAKAGRRVSTLGGVRDSLLVPRDERTLYGWLHVSEGDRIAEWMGTLQDMADSRIAFGEAAEGIEGFRLSHAQARSTGAVITASRKRERVALVRYRDVAPLSFLVERPTESRGWAEQVLGELAAVGDERERLRETLQVFLEEGENAVEAGRRLFVHRNTVKYRVDRACELLPEPLAARRLDVGLALRYLDLVGVGPLPG